MSETWLKPHIPDNFVNLPGYQLFRHNREGRGEEGLACTCATASVRGSLPLPPRNTALNPSIFSASHLSKADHFSSPSSIALRNSGTYLPSRPTSSDSIPLFLPQSSSEISILISTAAHTILIISLISAPATISTLYRTMTLTSSSSHTHIDHCLLSDQSQLVSHHQEPLSFLSSHDLIEVILDLLVHRTPPRPISIRDYSRFDLMSFLRSLQSLD